MISFLFLLLVAAAMPYLSYLSYQSIRKLELDHTDLQVSKRSVYLQSAALQIGLSLLGYYCSRQESYTITLISTPDFKSIAAVVCFLSIALFIAVKARKNKEQDESTLRYILPENGLDRIYWMLTVLVAAFCEEYIYRGVLFQMLLAQTHNSFLFASLLSAVIFGFGHGTQGKKAILQIIPFALGFHILVYISKGLILPMMVHFIYNICVELFFGKQIREKNV